MSCYLFQESLAEVGGMPHIQANYLERSQFDALICKFERRGDVKDGVRIKIAFQRPPPMVTLFRSNPAIEMVFQFAKGIRDLLENPSEPQEISVVKTSAWVKDKYVVHRGVFYPTSTCARRATVSPHASHSLSVLLT